MPDLIKILLADDDPEDMELLEDALLQAAPEAKLQKFSTGLAAMEFLRTSTDNQLPCLMILDYNMPQLNGAQLLARLGEHARFQAIPKVVLSTSGSFLHKQECLDSGASEYVVKPNKIKDIVTLAERLVTYCKD